MLRDWFTDFDGPLYTIDWTDRANHPPGGDELEGLGDFDTVKQLPLFDAMDTGS